MPVAITPVSTFSAVTAMADGDSVNNANGALGVQANANRTQFLYDWARNDGAGYIWAVQDTIAGSLTWDYGGAGANYGAISSGALAEYHAIMPLNPWQELKQIDIYLDGNGGRGAAPTTATKVEIIAIDAATPGNTVLATVTDATTGAAYDAPHTLTLAVPAYNQATSALRIVLTHESGAFATTLYGIRGTVTTIP